MKKLLIAVLVMGMLTLPVGGCGGQDIVSSASDSAVDAGADGETTTTTDWGKVTASRTYPTTPFTVGATVRVRGESFEQDFSGQVVTSKAQLDALNLSEEHSVAEYTDNFFADKALVVLEFRLTSGSIQLRVDNVWASGNTMWVRYTTLRPSPFTNDMAYRRILLEISQTDADGIEHIVGEQVPIQLPSGADIPNPTAL